MTRILGVVLLGGALFAAAAEACPPVVVVHRAVRVRPVIAVQFVPVYVPSYVATYGAPGGGPDVQSLLAEVSRLRALVEGGGAGKGVGGSAPGPAAVPSTGGALSAACARCHTGAGAKGKFKLFEEGGGPAALSGEQAGEALTAVIQGRMPQGKALTAEQKIQVLSELTGTK